jgi:hypothetical protein
MNKKSPFKNTEIKRNRMTKGHRKPKDWNEIMAIERMVKRKHRGSARGGKRYMTIEEREDYNKIAKILS